MKMTRYWHRHDYTRPHFGPRTLQFEQGLQPGEALVGHIAAAHLGGNMHALYLVTGVDPATGHFWLARRIVDESLQPTGPEFVLHGYDACLRPDMGGTSEYRPSAHPCWEGDWETVHRDAAGGVIPYEWPDTDAAGGVRCEPGGIHV